MKPVNLLPEQYRARRPSSGARGSSRIVIGALAALLVMAIAYALTTNQVNSHKGDIAAANSEIQQAQAKTGSQSSFGSFHDVKQTREASVKLLAGGRFDWERLMREVALVLPNGTWVLDMTASTGAEGTSGTTAPGQGASASSSASTSSTGAAGAAAAAAPSVHLIGCAVHQDDVAVLLVRLRKLNGATDASLTESAKEDDSASGQGSSDSAQGGSEGCGGGRFKFDVTVTFAAPDSSDVEKPSRVPARLGGGS